MRPSYCSVMIQVDDIIFQGGSREERLPCYSDDFPYVATRVVFDDGTRHGVPWHWHRAVEVFWIQSGSLEYSTPDSSMVFRAGECGFLNSNVLHMTNASSGRTVQMLHLFDPVLISGSPDSLIATRYVLPVTAGGRDMLLMPEGSDQNAAIRKAFSIDPGIPCYEMRIRNMMSDIWMSIMSLAQSDGKSRTAGADVDERVKMMLTFIHENYSSAISIADIASSACMSTRECHRQFRQRLHTTPLEYLIDFRIRMACRMLRDSRWTIAAIGYECGLGSASRFASVFKAKMGTTPSRYRAHLAESR